MFLCFICFDQRDGEIGGCEVDVVEECDNLSIHIELRLSWKSSTEQIPEQAELLRPVGDVPSLCIGAADSSRPEKPMRRSGSVVGHRPSCAAACLLGIKHHSLNDSLT